MNLPRSSHFPARHRSRRGLTLVEVMMALTILTILAAGIISAVMTAQNDAENNLYETTSLTTAISFLEQMTSINFQHLDNPPNNANGQASITFILGSGQEAQIPLNVYTPVDIPIISTEAGVVKKSLSVYVNPQVEHSADFDGFWLSVDYRWKHPRRDKYFEGTVRNMRSRTPVF